MEDSLLHAQACTWTTHAALIMEGEAQDPLDGGHLAPDALYRVALACGLRLTTDLDRLDTRPTPGWRICVEDGRTTLEWPRFRPLLDRAPLDLPDGWFGAARRTGLVMVFVGYGFGMREHAGETGCHSADHLPQAAEIGTLAYGATSLVIGRPHDTAVRRETESRIPAQRTPTCADGVHSGPVMTGATMRPLSGFSSV